MIDNVRAAEVEFGAMVFAVVLGMITPSLLPMLINGTAYADELRHARAPRTG